MGEQKLEKKKKGKLIDKRGSRSNGSARDNLSRPKSPQETENRIVRKKRKKAHGRKRRAHVKKRGSFAIVSLRAMARQRRIVGERTL